MPRPSTTDSIETSHDSQRRLNTKTSNTPSTPTTTNVPLIINHHNTTGDLANSNLSLFSSSDYRQPSTPIRLIQQHNLSTTTSNHRISNIHSLSHNDTAISSNELNISSPHSIPIVRSSSIQLNNNRTMTTPLVSPIQSTRTTPNSRPLMEDKCIQCIDDEETSENSMEHDEQITKSN